MNYAVSILFSSTRDDNSEPLWEERIILVKAIDEGDAKSKAEAIGREENHRYKASSGANVKWRFAQVERVCSIDEDIGNGTELFSRFLRESEAKSILTPFDDR